MSSKKYFVFFATILILSTVQCYGESISSGNITQVSNGVFQNSSQPIQKPEKIANATNLEEIIDPFEPIDPYEPSEDNNNNNNNGYSSVIYIPGIGFVDEGNGAAGIESTKLLTLIGVLIASWGILKSFY